MAAPKLTTKLPDAIMRPLKFSYETTLDAPPSKVFEWHEHPDALSRLNPEKQRVQILEPAPLERGKQIVLRIQMLGMWGIPWIAKLEEVERGKEFIDRQVQGPFKYWHHRHRFLPKGKQCIMRDEIQFILPGGRLMNWLLGWAAIWKLRGVFRQRHAVLLEEFGDGCAKPNS